MPWLQAHIVTAKAHAPRVERVLEHLGALSVTLTDAADEPMLEPPPGTTPIWRSTCTTGLFPDDLEPDELRTRLDQALHGVDRQVVRLEFLEDRAWERAWMERFHPMQFGERLWICPTGLEVEAQNAVIVTLDPGLAFGTGTHPTTALCLEWLDGAALKGKRIIDFGCGSGILGIAGARLGAASVCAVDHDPQAVLATTANAAANGVAGRVSATLSSGFKAVPADIVLANILANVLVELSDAISALVKPGGRLVLSGILEAQADTVRQAYGGQFSLHTQPRDEWIRIDGVKHR